MGIGFVRGRDFSATTDQATAPKVAILSDAAARLLFGTDDPIGRTVMSGAHAGAQGHWRRPEHQAQRLAGGRRPDRLHTVYSGASGGPRTDPLPGADVGRSCSARPDRSSNGDVDRAESADSQPPDRGGRDRSVDWRRAVRRDAAEWLRRARARPGRHRSVRHDVPRRRTTDAGVRHSHVARRRRARSAAPGPPRNALALVAMGLLVGIPMALAGTRIVASMLFHVAPTDLAAIGGVMVLMAVVAVCAGAIPAYRAARVDPMVALRFG